MAPSRFPPASPWRLHRGPLTVPPRLPHSSHPPLHGPQTALSTFPQFPHDPLTAPSALPPPLHSPSRPFPGSFTIPSRPFPGSLTIPSRPPHASRPPLRVPLAPPSRGPDRARPRRLLPFLCRPESAACSAAMEYLPAPAAPAQGHM